MSHITSRLEHALERVRVLFLDEKEGWISEIGLMEFLDKEASHFTRKEITWSNMTAVDYFDTRFSGDDRILMLYMDARFNERMP